MALSAAWDGDGIDENEEEVDIALDTLGLDERELDELREFNLKELYVWTKMAEHTSNRKEARDYRKMAAFFKRRAKAFNLLAARAAAETTRQEMEETHDHEVYQDPR